MRGFDTGPAGVLMMLVGLLLAGSSAWTAIGSSTWRDLLPGILIGLTLLAVGYALVALARARRARREHKD